jgi:hypothetical protein
LLPKIPTNKKKFLVVLFFIGFGAGPFRFDRLGKKCTGYANYYAKMLNVEVIINETNNPSRLFSKKLNAIKQ